MCSSPFSLKSLAERVSFRIIGFQLNSSIEIVSPQIYDVALRLSQLWVEEMTDARIRRKYVIWNAYIRGKFFNGLIHFFMKCVLECTGVLNLHII